MPNIFRKRLRSYTGALTWDADNDAVVYNLASNLHTCGWNVQYRYHYTQVITNADMSGFSGSTVFWQIIPPADVGYTGLIPIIIDVVPSGYVPPPTHFIFEVTGTQDKAVVHAAVVRCMLMFDPERLFAIGTDPLEPSPNTYIQYREYEHNDVFDSGPLHRGLSVFGAPAVALHTGNQGGATGLNNGGYAATTALNTGGSTSVFLYRNSVGGIDPYTPSFIFAPAISEQPVLQSMVEGVDRSTPVSFEITKADLLIAMGPFHCCLAQTSNGVNGHIEVAALNLPITDGTDVTAATFAIGGGVGGSTIGFRTKLFANGVNGGCYLQKNTQQVFVYSNAVQQPRLMSLFGFDANGTKWANGLDQLIEPWIGFNPSAAATAAPVYGKLPDALVAYGPFDADATNARFWDGFTWKAYTTLNGAGTLFFKATTDEGVPEPTCLP